MTSDRTTGAAQRASYRKVLGNRSFQYLSLAQLISLGGDQIARLALSVLVYDRTGSATATGLTYALSYLPAVLGGPLLAGLADRRPRRSVMIVCDLLRAVLVLAMAVPWMPLPVLLALLAIVTLVEAPFDAARGALLPDILPGEQYAIGGALGQVVLQSSMVAGFGTGGLLLLVSTPRELLALDACTFLTSAVLVRLVPWGRVRVDSELGTRAQPLADLRVALHVVFGDRRLRALVLVAWVVSAAAVAPEALAVPYTVQTGVGEASAGLLLAANPVGNVLAGLLLARMPAGKRLPLLVPLALLAVVPLAVCLTHPAFALVVALVALSGVGATYNLVANVRFMSLVAPEVRGRALGLVGTGLAVGQGLAIALAGILGDLLSPASAVGIAGLAGLAGIACWGPGIRRHSRSDQADRPRQAPGDAPEIRNESSAA